MYQYKKTIIFLVLVALTSGFGLMATITSVAAQVVTAEEIIRQLTSSPATRSLAKPGLRIESGEVSNSARPNIDLHVTFETASHQLTSEARLQLGQLSLALKSNALLRDKISIIGHTDARGTDQYNMALSIRRAGEVRRFLNQQFDLDLTRLKASGKGESELKDTSAPSSEINRRVEIVNLGH